MDAFLRIADVIERIGKNFSNPKAFNYHVDNQWRSISTQEFVENVRHLALGLVRLGLKKGDVVGILAASSPNWVIADMAIMLVGGVTVPLFANTSVENFLFEIEQTQIKTIFVSGQQQWILYGNHKKNFDQAIALESGEDGPEALEFDEILKVGKALASEECLLLQQLEDQVKPDDLATIIYTSGSTGVPKGVELTHRQLLGHAHVEYFELDPKNDRYLSILPLAHVFGRTLNLFGFAQGVSVYYYNDLKTLGEACRGVHPTCLVVVPRIIEKIYAKIMGGLNRAGVIKRTIGKWAINLAYNNEGNFRKKLCYSIADRLVYSDLREAVGGSIRLIICGGAALDPYLCHLFWKIGISIYEGWGMTEASTIAVNRLQPGMHKIGTVGPIMSDMQVSITESDELLVKGPVVMRGYYKNSIATAEALDAEGWLHTGDRGKIDFDGFVTLSGRIKELLKTSTGEYIAPVPIEQALCKGSHLIEMAMVIGDGRKFASCLLFPNFEEIARLKSEKDQNHLTDKEFLNSEYVITELSKVFENVNRHLNHWEQIQFYRFVLEPLTVESGGLTPSMKIRREVVAKKYQHLIESIYFEEK